MKESAFIDPESLILLDSLLETWECVGVVGAGGEVTENGIVLSGWSFETNHDRMASDSHLEGLKHELDGVIKVPEIVFLNNNLHLHHIQTKLDIQFHALDALKAWISENLTPFQVI